MPQQLDDRMMLLDAMVSDKHEASDYTIRSIETGNPQLLQLFQSIYQDEQRHVHMFMEAMTKRGWQVPLPAHPQDVNQIRNEATNKAGGLQAQYQPPGPAFTPGPPDQFRY
ncbi:MAG: spore coat protein [Thermoanaerobacteraceae bacterium]|nr:spore coat protein [Thermoanaerobacteraceae bacterium]